jgi:hypothetical protein
MEGLLAPTKLVQYPFSSAADGPRAKCERFANSKRWRQKFLRPLQNQSLRLVQYQGRVHVPRRMNAALTVNRDQVLVRASSD